MEDLSKRQIQILDFIKSRVSNQGYPPSIREICEKCGLKSTASVHTHLTTLENKGYIRRNKAQNRSIEITDPTFIKNSDFLNVPIVGNVSAGSPILAVENIEDSFPIPSHLVGSDEVFMLRIRGDSMMDVGIFNKDLVLVNQQSTASNGDIVVALIEDSATVKTFYKENGHFRLQPENENYEPIIVDNLTILGKVIGLYRVM